MLEVDQRVHFSCNSGIISGADIRIKTGALKNASKMESTHMLCLCLLCKCYCPITSGLPGNQFPSLYNNLDYFPPSI